MYDIFFAVRNDEILKNKIRSRFPFAKFFVVSDRYNLSDALRSCQKKSLTKFFWFVGIDVEINESFNFQYEIEKWDESYIHIFDTQVYLVPKSYDLNDTELPHKKSIDIKASTLASMDIFFISYDETNADENFRILTNRFPRTKRIEKVKGIHQAHIEAAKQSSTSMFWVVDGDAQISETFNFDCDELSKSLIFFESVHVFQSKNPINDLVYGYGGVKLLPKDLTIDMDISKVDMTTSISPYFIPVSIVSNVTAFNTDPFNTWKSAFRECVKLASKNIKNQKDDETDQRLETWCTVGHDRPFGEYSIRGALMGKEFGLKYANDIDFMYKINDWDWLKNEFNKS